jgi:hypothetical protein
VDDKLYELEDYIRTDYFLHLIDNFFNNRKIEEAKQFLESNFNAFHPEHIDNLMFYVNALICLKIDICDALQFVI